jgi:hypothetical protein
MNLVFHGSKTDALIGLAAGASILIPCGPRSVQSVQSTIASLPAKRGLPSGEFTQRKALLVVDETVMPMPVIIVTRRAQAVLG